VNVEKYTFGVGDRFAHQGQTQLPAILQARKAGVDVYPVWNKSNREHLMIGSKPDDVRAEADAAVAALAWAGTYYVDADHIGLKSVEPFIKASDFYTAESCPDYNPHFRQLLHIGFKIAAEMGERFTGALRANQPCVSRNVTENLFQRHLLPIFA
jgi:hypothetical protein